MINHKAELHNLKLENNEFTLIFFTDDGNEYHEHGQTLASMSETIEQYKKDHALSDIEIMSETAKPSISISLAYYMPF